MTYKRSNTTTLRCSSCAFLIASIRSTWPFHTIVYFIALVCLAAGLDNAIGTAARLRIGWSVVRISWGTFSRPYDVRIGPLTHPVFYSYGMDILPRWAQRPSSVEVKNSCGPKFTPREEFALMYSVNSIFSETSHHETVEVLALHWRKDVKLPECTPLWYKGGVEAFRASDVVGTCRRSENALPLSEIEPMFLECTAHTLVIIQTELSLFYIHNFCFTYYKNSTVFFSR